MHTTVAQAQNRTVPGAVADRYDFFVLQSSTAGGYALNQFLRAHPQVHLPERELVDGLFEQGRPEALCTRSANPLLIPPWRHACRLGFLLHARVQLEPQVPEQVASLCRGGAVMFQLVRNPIDVITASHKRYIQINIFRETARQLGLKGYELDVPIRTPEEVYEWLKPRLFYYAQGQRFARTFDRVELIDAMDLRPQRVDRTMRHLYGILGVDEGFRSELFYKDFHGFLQRMFEFSRMEMNAYGCKLPVRLDLSGNAAYVADDFTQVLDAARCQVRPLGGEEREIEVVLLTRRSIWEALPVKLRAHLTDSGMARRFLEEELLPGWCKLLEVVRDFIESHWVRELPRPLEERIRDELDEDCRQLFRLRPDLRDLWGW